MTEVKTIEIPISPDVQVLCDLLSITPEELLTQYMRDLCSLAMNGGSDERAFAKQYFLRTYLSSQSVFSNDCAGVLLEDYEGLYISAYPAIGNTGWEEQRKEMLAELHKDWNLRKEAAGNLI